MKVSDCCLGRTAFVMYVDLDPVPGEFHTPLSALLSINEILGNSISHYTPTVIFLNSETRTTTGRRRISFVVHVDLDPTPGAFHSKESAWNVIGNVLHERIPHYNPIVSIAPAEFQPHDIEGNK